MGQAPFFQSTSSLKNSNRSKKALTLSFDGDASRKNASSNCDFVIENSILLRYEGNAEFVILPDEILEIGAGAFAGNTALKNITIPQGVVNISEGAFHGCATLEQLTLPGSVTNVKRKAFCDCTSLKRLTFETGSGGLFIEDFAFQHCTALDALETTRDIEYIGKNAFADCLSLCSLILYDKDLIFIAKDAFRNCPNLRRVEICGELGFTAPFLPREAGAQKHHVKRVLLAEKIPMKRSVCCGKRLTFFTKRCQECKLPHSNWKYN